MKKVLCKIFGHRERLFVLADEVHGTEENAVTRIKGLKIFVGCSRCDAQNRVTLCQDGHGIHFQ